MHFVCYKKGLMLLDAYIRAASGQYSNDLHPLKDPFQKRFRDIFLSSFYAFKVR